MRSRLNSRGTLFIELCGVPASGKTTTADLLSRVLRARGIHCLVAREAASKAPMSQLKLDWRYVVWTLCDVTTRFLEAEQYEGGDVVIFDRGFFDVTCWLEWHREKGRLERTTFEKLRDFAEVSSWFGRVSTIFELRICYSTALARRRGFAGRILNRRTFEELERAYDRMTSELAEKSPRRRPVVTLETDTLTPEMVVERVLEELGLPETRRRR